MITSSDRWWSVKGKPHEALCADIKMLDNKLLGRSEKNLRNLRLYSNSNIESMYGDSYEVSAYSGLGDRLVLNICQSVVNAITAKISSNRPRCMPLTEGGDWKLRQQAIKLGKFFDGQFYQSQIYRQSRAIFRDACIFGTGAIKFWDDWRDQEDPKIAADRRIIENILVDPLDGRYGAPRMVHEVTDIGREVAMATWPNKRGDLQHATEWRAALHGGMSDTYADPITIAEAWHLPSSKTAGDGRHLIATDACTLLDEPWTVERFPLAFFKWLGSALGFYGDALIDQLVGIQVEINRILLKISQHMHLASSFVLAPRNTKLVKEHLVNTPWSVLEYSGDVPTFATVASISPEYFIQLDRLYAKAFEIAGITQLFATGLKPAGLDSGVAQREYKDTESERFMDVSQAWEEYHFRDIPEILVDMAKQIDERHEGGYSVMAKSADGLERIKWADVNLERDQYILQLMPTSYMPKLPAFKLQAAKELLELSPELQAYAIQLLDFPDLQAITRRIAAPTDYIERATDRMLYDEAEDLEEIYDPPDAFTDPAMALKIATGKLQRARMDGCPPERLDLLIRYMSECEALSRQAQEALQAQAMPSPAGVPPEMQPPGLPAQLPPPSSAEPMPEVPLPPAVM